jgi:hypothetical protein
VLEEHGAKTLVDATRGDDALHVRGDVGGAAAFGAEFEGGLMDHKFRRKTWVPD